jgi:hypothetical protein
MHFELDIAANMVCNDIGIEILFDQQKIFECTADSKLSTISHDFDDNPGQHVVTLIMTGKNSTHTKIDIAGNIISDIFFQISRLEFEQLDLQEVFCQGYKGYTHSFNSTQPEFLDEFYGVIGCNGRVEFKFSTPIYLWLHDKIS